MSPEEYAKAVLNFERFVIRQAGYICPIECQGRDAYEHHVQVTLTYFSECLDAEMYGMDKPTINSGIDHLDDNIARIERDYLAKTHGTPRTADRAT